MYAVLSLLVCTFWFSAAVEAEFKNGYYREGGKKIGTKADFFSFRTRPDLLAPRWNITIHDEKALAPGYIFAAPYKTLSITERGEAWIGPHIYDQNGELVWSGAPLFDHYKAFDIRLANVSGAEMLTAMYPHENSAVIMNKHYEIVKKVVHSSSWEYSNMHDFNVVQDGTHALVLTKDAATYLSKEKSAKIGFDGRCKVKGDGLKYMDIRTSPPKVLMEWNGTDHIGLDETVMRQHHDPVDVMCSDTDKWDLHHLNSIDRFPDGDFLLSARAASTLYKISHKTGEIVWRLTDGEMSDFDLPIEAKFNFQHHARVHGQNKTHIIISLLDNTRGPRDDERYPPRPYSAGLILSLDTVAMTGQLLGEYPHPYKGRTTKRGSAHLQPNGNMLMCWSNNVLISEHTPHGRVIMEGNVLPELDEYRAYKFSWVGEPLDPPDVSSAAFVSGNTTYTMAFVSWNGATEVFKWKLYAYDVKTGYETPLVAAKKRGFETSLVYEGFARYVIVEALDKHYKSIGKSRPVLTTPTTDQAVDMPAIGSTDDLASEESTSNTFPKWDSPSKPSPDLPADKSAEDEVSHTAHPSEAEHASWTDIFQENEIIALASAAGGFVACVALGAVIWALQKFRGKPWWRSRTAKYESLPSDHQEAEDGDAEVIELQDEK